MKFFCGKSIQASWTHFCNKPPDNFSGTTQCQAHQDIFYSPYRPPDKHIQTFTALEDCTLENGCLFVVPGSHKYPELEHKYSVSVKQKVEEKSLSKSLGGIMTNNYVDA